MKLALSLANLLQSLQLDMRANSNFGFHGSVVGVRFFLSLLFSFQDFSTMTSSSQVEIWHFFLLLLTSDIP